MLKKSKRAFSLIEVLIAIAIVALGASLAVPVVKGEKDRAAYKISQINLKSVGKAMEKHYLEKGVYPVFNDWAEVCSEESPLREYLDPIPEKDGFQRVYKVNNSTDTAYEFHGFSIKGKQSENFPDYKCVTGAKLKNKKPGGDE